MFSSCKYLINSKILTKSQFPIGNALRSYAAKTQLVEVKEQNNVREIIFNDEKTRHALSIDMMCSLHEAITKNWDDKNLRCIVLSSKGPVFCAGHNLKDLAAHDSREYNFQVFNKLSSIIKDIRTGPVPVIAKVNGLAAAGGVQLVASCDIIVCSDKSKFSCPGANFGVYCSTPGIAVARVMQRPKSSYMLLTGLPISAQEAYIAGLVSRVVPECELDNEVNNITDAIKIKSRAIVEFGRKFYYKQLGLPIDQAFEQAVEIMCDTLEMADSKEGIKSFVEKRKPQWKHE